MNKKLSCVIFICLMILISCSNENKQTNISSDEVIFLENKLYHTPPKLLSILFGLKVSGEYNGQLLDFYSNGKRKLKVNFKNGRAEGLSEYYYENGNIKMKGELKTNIFSWGKEIFMVGKWRHYYESGELKTNTTFDAGGLKNGEYKAFFKNGSLKSIGRYHMGFRFEKWDDYSKSGETINSFNYVPLIKTIKKEKTINGFFQKIYVAIDTEIPVSGRVVDMQIDNSSEMLNKFINSISRSSEEINKEVNIYRNEYDVIEGLKNGKFAKYVNNILIESGVYSNGILKTESIYQDGIVRSIKNYTWTERRAGDKVFKITVPNGTFEKFDKKNNLVEKGEYVLGDKTGKWITYKNEKVSSIVVHTTVSNKKYVEAFYNGDIYYSGTVFGSFTPSEYKIPTQGKTGKWIFYKQGKLFDTGHYNDNKLMGKWVSYYENGNIESVRYFNNGNSIGTWTYYYEDGKILKTEIY